MSDRKHREERECAQLAREEEERAAAVLAHRKRWIAAGGGLVLAGLILFAVVQWMLQPLPTDVNGHLTNVREMSFVEGAQDFGGISPVCGCKHPSLDSWRGVEFAGRQASLHLRGGYRAQWLISAAEPRAISLTGEETVVRATAYRLPAHSFDPLTFARVRTHGRGRASSTNVRAPKFSIVTRGELKVAMTGPIPIGAWIPFPDSSVRLTTTRSPFPEEPGRPRLVEHYPPQVGYWPDRGGTPHPKNPQIYPLGDFLGPNLVLWTDDPDARVVGTSFGKPAGTRTVTAVVISRAIFSTRVGVTPIGDSAVAGLEQVSLHEPDGMAEYGFDSSGQGGTVALTVDQPLAPADYQRVQRLVSEDPKKWVLADINPEFGGRPDAEYDVLQEQRYPPLPHHAGFNVFGPLKQVTFHDVNGDLTVGDGHVDLSGGGNLEINEVEVFRNSDDEQLISSPLSTDRKSAELDFGAHGTVIVNGTVQKTVESQFATPMRAVAAILTLIGAIVGLLKALRRPRGTT
jgi:hypothetical protein